MGPKLKNSFFLGLLAALLFLPFLGGTRLFDWDEINFAESAREMIALKNYLRVHINFLPFWEKPPFFMWLQAGAMHLFGVGDYAARFPNAVCGIITIVLLFRLGVKLYDIRFGVIWALAYMGSILPHLYFKSGIIDPYFNLFIFLALYNLIFFYWKKEAFTHVQLRASQWNYLLWAGTFMGLALLTKGPAGYLIIALTLFVYWVDKKFRFFINPFHFILFTLTMFVASLVWYGLEALQHGTWFIEKFIAYNYKLFSTPDSGHGGFPGYHFVVLLIGCFPASVFALRAMAPQDHEHIYQKDFKRWMMFLFWVVLILFTIVKSKIVHYSSMCYFPLTYLASLVIYQIWEGKIKFSKWMQVLLWVIGGIFIFATISLPWVMQYPELLQPLLKADPFAVANLEADVNWTGAESFAGIFLLIVLIVSMRAFWKKAFRTGFATLLLGNALFIFLTIIFFVGRIEGYSQAAAMEFYESLQGKDVYILTVDFKSYGHHYYARKQPPKELSKYQSEWLKKGSMAPERYPESVIEEPTVEKDVYVITKITAKDKLLTNPYFKLIKEKNGFAFFYRPSNSSEF